MTFFVSGCRVRWWEDVASCCFQVFLFLAPRPAPPVPAPTAHLFCDSRHPRHHRPSCLPLPHNPWQRNRPEDRAPTGVFLSGGVLRVVGMASFLASQGFRPPSRASVPRSSHWRAALPVGARPPGRLVFPACCPFGYPPPPATTRRIMLLQRFSFDSGPTNTQHAPADHQRHLGDEFCHPAPGPWTLITGMHHPRAGAQPPPHRLERAPRTWCARRTLRTNNRLRVFVKGASCVSLATIRLGMRRGEKFFAPTTARVRSGRRCTLCPRKPRRCSFPRSSVGTQPRALQRPA